MIEILVFCVKWRSIHDFGEGMFLLIRTKLVPTKLVSCLFGSYLGYLRA